MQQIRIPTNIPDFTDAFLSPDSIGLTFAKLAFIVVAILYVVYAVVISRQVRVMNATIETPLGPVIQVLVWLNLAVAIAFAIGVFLFL